MMDRTGRRRSRRLCRRAVCWRRRSRVRQPGQGPVSPHTCRSSLRSTGSDRRGAEGARWRGGSVKRTPTATPPATLYWDCTLAEEVAWFCDVVLALEDGPTTDAGVVVVQGLFDGYDGESLP